MSKLVMVDIYYSSICIKKTPVMTMLAEILAFYKVESGKS